MHRHVTATALVDDGAYLQNNLKNWFEANKLTLNQSKSQTMVLSLNSNTMETLESIKFQGVQVDPHLTWESYVNNVTSQLSKYIYLIRNLKNVVLDTVILKCYFSYFHWRTTYIMHSLTGVTQHIWRKFLVSRFLTIEMRSSFSKFSLVNFRDAIFCI
nr:unnamed protein product [Callosobruchus chinensis]